MTQLLSDTCKK